MLEVVQFLVPLVVGLTIGYFLFRRALPGKENELLKDNLVQLKWEVGTLKEDLGGLQALLASKEKELDEKTRRNQELDALLAQEAENNRKILSLKKSSEIRTGNIAEQLAPLLMTNHSTKSLRWIGQPIDYIAFDPSGIYFIEVKSGKSHLSYNQKQIKKLVQNKQVYWEEFRIRGKRNKDPKK